MKQCECGGELRVIDTRDRDNWIYRRRKCYYCGKKITTVEIEASDTILMLAIRDSQIKHEKAEITS